MAANWQSAWLAFAHETHNNQTKDSQESCAPAMATGVEMFLGVFHLYVHGEYFLRGDRDCCSLHPASLSCDDE